MGSTKAGPLTKTSYLETFIRVPVLDIVPSSRYGVKEIDSLVCSSDGQAHDLVIYAYWPTSPPRRAQCISFVGLVGYDDTSKNIQVGTSAGEAEIAAGDPDEADYAERNIMQFAWWLRGTGQSIKVGASEAIVEGTSYINGRLVNWVAKLIVNRDSPRWATITLPAVGEVCGFRGVVTSVETKPYKHFVIQLESYSAPMPAGTQAKDGPKTPTKDVYRAAYARAHAKRSEDASSSASGSSSPSLDHTPVGGHGADHPSPIEEDEPVPQPPPSPETTVNEQPTSKADGKKRARTK